MYFSMANKYLLTYLLTYLCLLQERLEPATAIIVFFIVRREQCGCTADMTISSEVKHSDCIQRVYRLVYGETLKPKLYISTKGKFTQQLTIPYTLEELNNRRNYYTQKENRMIETIGFRGSGLYHFRAKVTPGNQTFCYLSTEFLVFIDQPPLPQHVVYLVWLTAGMCFGMMLFVLFLLKLYPEIVPISFDKKQSCISTNKDVTVET